MKIYWDKVLEVLIYIVGSAFVFAFILWVLLTKLGLLKYLI